MKTLTFLFIAAGLAAASDSIPAQATQVGANLYRYTAPNGKTWLYSRTPFGVSKREDKTEFQFVGPTTQAPKVTDLGDQVKFEFQTPFGVSVRVTPKADLTDAEKALLPSESQPAKTA